MLFFHELMAAVRKRRTYILAVLLLFVASISSGVVVSREDPLGTSVMLENLQRFVEKLVQLPSILLALVIFLNNVAKTALALFGGIVAGIIPFFMVSANGFLLGLLLGQLESFGKNPWLAAGALLPHGIIELGAFFLGASYGLWLGVCAVVRVFRKESLRPALHESVHVFVYLIVPLLFVAALIEVFVTPRLLHTSI